MKKSSFSQKGFTLIELLIVIVIIGILAGVVLSVMNPAAQIKKANETVLRANTDKICLAMNACAVSRSDAATSCITLAGISTNDPTGTPALSTYAVAFDTPIITVTSAFSSGDSCSFACTYNTTDGSSTKVSPVVAADCVIE